MKIATPSNLKFPSYLMNFPFTVDNREANNPLMNKNSEKYNYNRAFQQFMDFYSLITAEGALVYLLPSKEDLQDLPFVANLGATLPHVDPPTVLVANFKSAPRKGEDEIGKDFFECMRYKVFQPPHHWEGEADLKWIRGNIYAAGYGIRSDIKSYMWMKDKFSMKVLPIRMRDPKLYHFDCMFFPLSEEKALVATSVIDSEGIRLLEKYVEIVEVPAKHVHDGWTNAVRLNNKIFHTIPEEKSSQKALDALLESEGFESVGVQLGEFDKSGADLSCFILHLNFNGRKDKDFSVEKDFNGKFGLENIRKESIRDEIRRAMK